MSTESKRAYRFDYLKSEQWQNVRLEALAREDAKCQICGERSTSNDAHHVWYPNNIYKTKAHHLVILCRPCHDLLHALFPECKTSINKIGWEIWERFRKEINRWRKSKMGILNSVDGITIADPKQLRERLRVLEARIKELGG